jgi:hypothetical protein
MLSKGVVGALIYVQKLQMEDTSQQSPPELTALLEQFKDIF